MYSIKSSSIAMKTANWMCFFFRQLSSEIVGPLKVNMKRQHTKCSVALDTNIYTTRVNTNWRLIDRWILSIFFWTASLFPCCAFSALPVGFCCLATIGCRVTTCRKFNDRDIERLIDIRKCVRSAKPNV